MSTVNYLLVNQLTIGITKIYTMELSTGIAYSFLHIRHVLTTEETKYFLPLAQKYYECHVRHLELLPPRDPKTE